MKASNSVKNRGKITSRYLLTALFCMSVLWIIPSAADAAGGAESEATLAMLKADFPDLMLYKQGDRITRIYGTPLGAGSSALDVAEQFKIKYSTVFGVDPDDLYPESMLYDKRRTQPVMYNRQTGKYKFRLVYYSQFKDGIPVYGADLRLLVRNKPGYPLVMAASALRDLGDFTVPAGVGLNPAMAQNAARSFNPTFINFTEPRLVVWAGSDDMDVEPALAMEIVAENNFEASLDYEKWLFLIDAQTGEILLSQSRIVYSDVSGVVRGRTTQGSGADTCGTENGTPLPYARVYIDGGDTVYTDEYGEFTISNEGEEDVTVVSHLRGSWFRVFNHPDSSDAMISWTVDPSQYVYFMHNPMQTETDFTRGEANAYFQINIARDYVLAYNDSFPGLLDSSEFAVYANTDEKICNGLYIFPDDTSYGRAGPGIMLGRAGIVSADTCPNTAFSTIIHHEYGHHLEYMAGISFWPYGQYHQGMADVMAVLITDTPEMARGIHYDCNAWWRTAQNTRNYPCSGSIDTCGTVLSASVWDTRDSLQSTNPSTYRDIISNIAINAMFLHTGELITPEITVDYLTLDDDDENLSNGTPHYQEIIGGFGAHNMDAPVIAVKPLNIAGSAPTGQSDIDTLRVSNLGAGDLEFTVSAIVEGTPQWLSVDPDSGKIKMAGDPIIIEVTMDATGLTVGTYNGTVKIISDAPVDSSITIPVQFTVTRSRLGGKIDGIIAGINGPIPGVRVAADDGAGNTDADITDKDGAYSMFLPSSTYDISFSHPDYIGATESRVTVADGEGVSLNIEMEPNSTLEIPTLSEWGMMVLALLLLSIGTIAVVRRRKAAISKAG